MVLLAAILAAAALLRIAYLREILPTPDFRVPSIDARFNDYWARGIASGEWTVRGDETGYVFPLRIGDHPYFRPPGYPFFLAGVYRLAGGGYTGVAVVQMTLGLLSMGLGYLLARRLFGWPSGIVSVVLMGAYWAFPFFETQLQEATLLVVIVLCLLHVLVGLSQHATFPRAAVCGLLVGLFAIVRPNILLFVPALWLWLWWVWRIKNRERSLLASVSGVLLGVTVVIAPVTIRNFAVTGDFVLISANGGINLHLGNNPTATGLFSADSEEVHQFNTCFDYPRVVAGLGARSGRDVSYADASRYFASKARRYMLDHPWSFVSLTAKRMALFWGPHEIGHNRVVHCDRLNSRVLRRLPVRFPAVLALGMMGFVLVAVERRRGFGSAYGARDGTAVVAFAVIASLFLVIYSVSFSLFFAAALFRMPVVPVLLPFAAFSFCKTGHLILTRNWRAAATHAGTLLCIYALAQHAFVAYEPDLAKWHYDRGLAAQIVGEDKQAMAEYESVLELAPDNASALTNMGTLLARRGEHGEALLCFGRALKTEPDNVLALRGAGIALMQQGHTKEAIRSLEKAVLLWPNDWQSLHSVGVCLAREERAEEALTYLRKALTLAPHHPELHYDVGLAFARSGNPQAAAEYFHGALTLKPDYEAARRELEKAKSSSESVISWENRQY